MKKTSTKRALVGSVATLSLCAAMLAGSTYAWFTDSVSTSINTIQSGVLDIQLQTLNGENWEAINEPDAAPQTLHFIDADENDLWEPGVTYKLAPLKVVNAGNLALKFNLYISELEGNSPLKLAEVLDVMLYTGEGTPAKDQYVKVGTLAELLEYENGAAYGALAPTGKTLDFTDAAGNVIPCGSESAPYHIALHMQETANNDYQDLSISGMKLDLLATQYTYEYDSYGNQYDKGADAKAIFGGTVIKDALTDPEVKEVTVGENIDMNKPEFTDRWGNATVNVGDGKTLNLNGNAVVRPDQGSSGDGLSFDQDVTATVENGSIIGEGSKTAVDIDGGANVTFKDIHFISEGADTAVRVRANGEGEITKATFIGCTFENAPVKIYGRNGATEVEISFIDCNFKGTYKLIDENGNQLQDYLGHNLWNNYLINAQNTQLFGSISFDNCQFDFDASGSRYKQDAIEFYGCYQGSYPGKMLNVNFNNVTITTKNADPVDFDSRYKNGINFTETGVNTYTVDGVSVKADGTAK